MTGGEAIILDKIGHNFASGMSGGICFIKNTEENLENINKELVSIYDLNENDLLHLKQRIDDFCKRTNSLYAKDILKNIKINDFVKIIPNDYYSMLKLLDKYKDEENFELKAFEETIR